MYLLLISSQMMAFHSIQISHIGSFVINGNLYLELLNYNQLDPLKDMNSEQENIFNAKKRTADDVVKYPYKLRGGEDEQIEKLLKQQSDKHNENFEKYMLRHYANFNLKINKCKLKCAQKGKDYSDIKVCYSRCETGVNTFKRFVDQRIQQMQSLLNQCISAAGQLPNSVMETYRCYDLYNKGYPHLRSIIKEESLYYQ